MDWKALGIATGLVVGVVILEALLTTEGIKTWYPTLKKPKWLIPMWGWAIVAVVAYLIDGYVAYRVLTSVPSREGVTVCLTALAVLMVFNALFNYPLFKYRDPRLGFLGVISFLAPLIVLQVALFVYEPVAAWTHMIYAVWVVAYDLPAMYQLWKLNPG
jgi:tryptophan-rich sensory protein